MKRLMPVLAMFVIGVFGVMWLAHADDPCGNDTRMKERTPCSTETINACETENFDCKRLTRVVQIYNNIPADCVNGIMTPCVNSICVDEILSPIPPDYILVKHNCVRKLNCIREPVFKLTCEDGQVPSFAKVQGKVTICCMVAVPAPG